MAFNQAAFAKYISASQPSKGGTSGGSSSSGFSSAISYAQKYTQAKSNAGITPYDSVQQAKDKLAKSIALINQSDAPGAAKSAANAQNVSKSDHENLLTKALNLLTKPKTAVVAGISHVFDSDRNFLKDLRHNVGTADVLANADWFKNLPTAAKMGIGLAGDIAFDPLTYLAGSSIIEQAGGKAGLAAEAAAKNAELLNTAKTAEALGNTAHAAQLTDRAIEVGDMGGRLLMKGSGGIGGMSNEELARFSSLLGRSDEAGNALRGGLYWNVPGTGRIGRTLAGWAGADGLEPIQIALGRGGAVRKVSALADEALNQAKLVGRARTTGDDAMKIIEDNATTSKWYQGGEGALKRAAIQAHSPQEALMYQTVLNTSRQAKGAARILQDQLMMRLGQQIDLADKVGVEQPILYHALGGNQEAIDTLKSASPELHDMVMQFRDDFKMFANKSGRDFLQAKGINPDLMPQVLDNVRPDWQPTSMTDEFKNWMSMQGGRGGASTNPINKHAEYVAGHKIMGQTLAHPTEDLVRLSYVDPTKVEHTAAQRAAGVTTVLPGEPVEHTLGVITKSEVLADRAGAARVAAGEDWHTVGEEMLREKYAPTLSGENRNVNEDMVRTFVNGKLDTVPASQVFAEPVPAHEGGLTVRQQVNELTSQNENIGHALFDEDYGKSMIRYINQYTKAYEQEIHFAMLSHYGLAELKELPKSVSAAGAAIDRAAAAAADAAVAAEKAGDRTVRTRMVALQREHAALQRVQAAINDSTAAVAAATAGSPEARALEKELQGLLQEHANLAQELEQAYLELAPHETAVDLMRRQMQGERGKGMQSILGAPDKPLAEMTTEELAAHEQSLDLGLGNAEKMKPDLQAELKNAQDYEDVAANTQVSRQELNTLRSEVRSEAQGVAEQMRSQVDAVGGRLESPWNSPGGEWDWWKELSRSQQRALRPYMGGGEAVRNGASSFGGAAVGRISDGMGVDVFAEQWRQIRNLSPDTNISEVMHDWAGHVLQMKDAEKVASGASGYTSLVQDWMAPNMFSDSTRRLTPELLFPTEKTADSVIAENLSQHLAREYHAGDVPTRISADVEAELGQLEINSKNLVNRYSEVMAEHGRREALIVSGQEAGVESAIKANLHDPVAVEQVTNAAKGLADEMPNLPVKPAFEVPTAEGTTPLLAEARQRTANMRQDILQAQAAGKASAERVNEVLTELDGVESTLSDAAERIAQLDAEHEALLKPFTDQARQNLDEATDAAVETNRAVRQSLAMVIDGENRALERLAMKIDDHEFVTWMRTPQFENTLHSVVKDYWSSISRAGQARWDVADALSMLVKLDPKVGANRFVKYFDSCTRFFKAWTMAQPGFIIRHGYSGMFMNYMFDVSPGAYRAFLKADNAFRNALKAGASEAEALAAVPEHLREAYGLVNKSGVLSYGTQTESYVGRVNEAVRGKPSNLIDRASNTWYNKKWNSWNSEIGHVSRGAAAMDAAMKTKSMDRIYDIVFKAHFNYEDITNFEKQWMTRISPFYIYFRKAIPAMVEGVFRNPKAFARVAEFKHVIDSQTPIEDVVPEWMRDRMLIRLPFSLGAGQSYLMPDLPVRSLTALTNPRELVGQLNPLIKTPIEMQLNSKLFFGDSSPFQGLVQPPAWLKASQLLKPLSLVGLATPTKGGDYLVNDKALYAIEQFLPFMGKARRLLPTEPRYQDRLPTTLIDFFFGAGLRTNTKSDIQGELTARQDKVNKIAENLGKTGYGGYQTWTKQVAVSRKPTKGDKRPYLTLIQPKGGIGKDSPYTNVAGKQKSAAQALADAFASGQLQKITADAAKNRATSGTR